MGNILKKCCKLFFKNNTHTNTNKNLYNDTYLIQNNNNNNNNLKESLLNNNNNNNKNKNKKNLIYNKTKNPQNINNITSIKTNTTKILNKEKEKEKEKNSKINISINIHDFLIIKTLGKGSYGKVILVQHYDTKIYYAMKILNKELLKQTNQIINTKNEREILEKIIHPFILKIHYAFQNSEKLYLIMEFMQGGELYFHLRRDLKFSENRTRLYLCEILLALEHLHEHNIIYRDLKPENILLDIDGHIKLADFGLAKILNFNNRNNNNNNEIKDNNYDINNGNDNGNHMDNKDLNNCNNNNLNESFESIESLAFTICGTPEYLAPEIFQGKGYKKSVDFWSFGILAYEMLIGKYLYLYFY
jgi:protein-serine/threonine kinase